MMKLVIILVVLLLVSF
ncbi:TPA: type I toxin-antitoxin system Ibs family toxin [Escherichia coli]|nr:type I toxin-antitoxin system Ibs family toxin [Escherichia coli]EIF6770213.1 type I toxin-antitoxin system Ibs family toxin [Escherichia coli]HAN7627067.1 type I toxin-antitoxin system Ibs family toxin [Escherichia coli]HBB0288987.1 type I toxin-antitoxin system Ibs family toxin [Escherichia coli]HBC8103408.1 type I toxin-antitoxin system Ibs family toxin [Escherichia coli]